MLTQELIESYYAAFNSQNVEQFLSLLTEDVIHDINQGGQEIGKQAFRKFLEHMNRCYREEITELVVMTNQDGTRAAAEFVVQGCYLQTDEGLPPAKGQSYRLPAGAFFAIREAKIARISNTYNLQAWLRQVSE